MHLRLYAYLYFMYACTPLCTCVFINVFVIINTVSHILLFLFNWCTNHHFHDSQVGVLRCIFELRPVEQITRANECVQSNEISERSEKPIDQQK
jgi:hypothetical protein